MRLPGCCSRSEVVTVLVLLLGFVNSDTLNEEARKSGKNLVRIRINVNVHKTVHTC